MNSHPRIFSAVCAVAGVVLGFAIGAWAFSRTSSSLAPAPKSTSGSATFAAAPTLEDPRFASDDVAIGAVFSAWQQKNPLRRGRDLKNTIDHLEAGQLAQMVERIAEFNTGEMQELLVALLKEWAMKDPKAAATWARPSIERLYAGARKGTDWAILSAWCAADPESAIALAVQRPDASQSQTLVTQAVFVLVESDPAGQLDRMAALPAGRLRESAISTALAKWAETDPSAALARLDELPPGARRDSVQTSIFGAWAKKDPAGALAEMGRRIESGELGPGRGNLAYAIGAAAAADPAVSVRWAESLPEDIRTAATFLVAASWASKEPTAALEWAQANGLALDQSTSLGGGYWGDRSILDRALESDSKKTIEWLQTLPPGTERTSWLAKAAMNTDVESARDVFKELPPAFQSLTAPSIAYRLAHTGTNEAVSWSKEIAAGSARQSAITNVVSAIGRGSAEQLDSLIEQYPSGADRDAALRGAVQGMRGKATQALPYAQRISDPAIRERAFQTLASSWLYNDPADARVWLESTNELSPEVKAMLVRSMTENQLRY